MKRWVTGIFVLCFGMLTILPANAATAAGSANVRWATAPTLAFSLTPNYASGFGTVKAAFGTPGPGAPGPSAMYQAGSVDFGNVLQGAQYLYKYAAHLNITTNASGFKVYAEGSADFTGTGTNAGNTQPINQSIFWLPSVNGSSQSDSNNGYSPATPFNKTTQAGASYNNPHINYAVYPAPIFTASSPVADLYYDFQLKVNNTASLGAYYVYIVYTVVTM